jgi:predicted histidine transporter YuiF (NhaC family)
MTTNSLTLNFSAMELSKIVTVLIITVFVFLVLLILGVRKSYKLKAENERLSKENTEKDKDKAYEDFTEGHLY